MRSSALFLCVGLVSWACGCGIEPAYLAPGAAQEGSPEVKPPVEGPEAAPEVARQHLSTCALEPAWEAPTQSWLAAPGLFAFAPQGGLLVRSARYGERVAYRLRDGAALFWLTQNLEEGSLSEDWAVYADEATSDEGQTHLALRALVTERALDQSAPLLPSSAPALSADGRFAVVMACEDERATLWRWEAGGALEAVSSFDDPGCAQWHPRAQVALTPDGRAALAPHARSGALSRFDLTTGQRHVVEAHAPLSEEFAWPYTRAIIDISVHPSGREVATLGADGVVRRWSLPELSPLGEALPAGSVEVNLNSYLPSVAAVVAWSPDGSVLAHTDPSGALALRDGETMAPLRVLPRPAPQGERAEGLVGDGLLGVAFGPGMDQVALSGEAGVSLWRCAGAAPEPAGAPLEVRLQGPARVRVGEEARFVATHIGTDHLHGHAFFVDGAPMGPASTFREQVWTFDAPGTYEVEVQLEDGLGEGRASVRVEVVP